MGYDDGANMTIVAAVLVVGLLVGAGVGYYMAPVDTGDTTTPSTTVPTEPTVIYSESGGNDLALSLSVVALAVSGVAVFLNYQTQLRIKSLKKEYGL